MKLLLQKIILVALICVSGMLLYFLTKTEQSIESIKVCFCVLTFLLVPFYFNNRSHDNSNSLILSFIIFHLLAEFISISKIIPSYKLLYTAINLFYIISYSSLIYLMFERIDLKILWQKFKAYVIIMLLFAGVIIYIMNEIMFSGTKTNWLSYPFLMDTSYNVTVVVLMCVSFLCYLYNDSKKDLVLFLLCLVFSFSEVAQLAYIYFSDSFFLFVLFSIFKLLGIYLCLYYMHIKSNIYYKMLS